MQILPWVCRQGSLLLIETVQCTTTLCTVHSNTVLFFCQNFRLLCNRDVRHRRLCEDNDKIPEDRTSTYILHLSGPVHYSEASNFFVYIYRKSVAQGGDAGVHRLPLSGGA